MCYCGFEEWITLKIQSVRHTIEMMLKVEISLGHPTRNANYGRVLTSKRKLVALLSLSFWCLVMVVWLFLAVPWVCLRFVIVVFSDHTHLLFLQCFGCKFSLQIGAVDIHNRWELLSNDLVLYSLQRSKRIT